MGPTLVGFWAAFFGSAVESVEALTIVLAVGLTRGWRAPLSGALTALVTLAVLVLLFGQLLVSRVPESALKLVVGTLILLFGLRWLHKAVLRSAGVISIHDEDEEFRATTEELKKGAGRADWVGFMVSFKGVLLEGLEVAFIVFGVGSSTGSLPVAAAGGLLAVFVVAALGAALRRPLTQVPENLIKYGVGVMLSGLGTFWAVEGMGGTWPLDAGSVVFLLAFYLAVSQLGVRVARRYGRRAPAVGVQST